MPPKRNRPKILFATSEAHPLIKTGGLADVSSALPVALQKLGCDIRVVLPAYGDILTQNLLIEPLTTLQLPNVPEPITLSVTTLGESDVQVWLVEHLPSFSRAGNPYVNGNGQPWTDNAERFALFSKIVVRIALDQANLNWQPDIVHCNDWQTGLVPALLKQNLKAPPSLFTIHNLAYQGLFDYGTFQALQLPPSLWSPEGLEFYGHLSFIKGGLFFSDRINTVSKQYAKEIQTPAFGYGLEGLLHYRQDRLSGIINGIDDTVWNPRTDQLIAQNYSGRSLPRKQINKNAVQTLYQLPRQENIFLLGFIGRLVDQKGIDLIIEFLQTLKNQPIQCCFLGTGEQWFHEKLLQLAQQNPEQIGVTIGYDEKTAHLIEAGVDAFLMPSRFEPCGLNQLYSLRYGTVPIVHFVGGLADTIIDATDQTIADGTATGFTFDQPTAEALISTVDRAFEIFRQPKLWQKLMRNGMRIEYGWRKSAREYYKLYRTLQLTSIAPE